MYSTPYTIDHTLYTIHYMLYTTHTTRHTPYTIHSTLYTTHHALHIVHHTPYTTHHTLHTTHTKDFSLNTIHHTPLAEEPPSGQSGDPAQKRELRILEEGGFTEKMKNGNRAGKRSRQAVELFTPPIAEPKRKSKPQEPKKLKEEHKKKKPPQPKLTKGEEERQHIESINVSCLCG
jgi:hypothetical protein